jgi:uncharacterized protein (DUF58 family)
VTGSASARLGVYTGFASVAFLLALALGRPELVALGAPFAAFLVLALALGQAPELTVAMTLADERTIEGQPVDGELEISAATALHEVEISLALPYGVELVEGASRFVLRLAPGERRTLPFRLVAWRWGAFRMGALDVRVRDRFGLVSYDARIEGAVVLRAYPRPERLRSLVAPLETQPITGNRVARTKGEESSSPTCARSFPATASDGSTGARAPGGASSTSTSSTRSATATSSSSWTASPR